MNDFSGWSSCGLSNWKNVFFSTLATATLCSVPADAKELKIPVNSDFETGSVSIDGYGKGYEFVIAFIEFEGEVFVCGAGIYPDASSAVGVRELLRKTSISMNGQTIIRDLAFFTKAKRGADLFKEDATCKGTGAPDPKGSPSFNIRWPSGSIRF